QFLRIFSVSLCLCGSYRHRILCSLLRGGFDFLNPSRFSAEFTDVIQLRASHASRPNNFNSIDDLGLQREYAFNAMSKGNFTDGKSRPNAAVFLSDANALEDLNALLIALFDFYVDFDRISRSEIRDVRA